ncbi:carcinoembryonic antigen-related cell adhesion molecule 3-like [Acomys russatus]|uniref:carcinoembryonic antigen-related cell adhesion molecule 3-like n=1 Tax=Acomys russatus TaxID=60746 RepID=UPI0021E2E55E|nr:carcinoembryonic antigen-related cell adhesion molecule 3-like [Acomys russatus]
MAVSSVLSFKECNPWQGLLLMASLLTCWHLSTTTYVTIKTVPYHVFEGDDVLLLTKNLPDNLLAFVWFKGMADMNHAIVLYAVNTKGTVKGRAHSGRETIYSDGSLQIHSVTLEDTGFYTLQTFNKQTEIVSTSTVYLHVYTSLLTCGRPPTSAQPTIELVPPNVAKGGSVLLRVHNLPEKLQALFWYKGVAVFKSQEVSRYIIAKNASVDGPAHSGRETMYSNGSLLIHNVTGKDTGFYTLQTLSTDVKEEVVHVQLLVGDYIHPSSAGHLIIEPVPLNIVEGSNALLRVHNMPEKLWSFSWYKGVFILYKHEISRNVITTNRRMLGPAHSGRETVYPNGSLLLHNATQEDTGFYTLRTLNMQFETQETHVQLHIYKPVTQPIIQATSTTVRVQSSVVLTCLSSDTGISIQWFFNDQILLTEKMTLSPTKCQLTIDPVRMEDAGEYRCEVSNPVSSKTSFPLSLTVMNE